MSKHEQNFEIAAPTVNAYESAARKAGWRPMTAEEVAAVEWLRGIDLADGDIFTDDSVGYDPHDGFRDWAGLCEWHGIGAIAA